MESGSFTSAEGRAAGLTAKQLRGPSVCRVHRDRYLRATGDLDLATRIEVARTVLPSDAVAVGTTILRVLGVDLGDRPLRFATQHPHPVRRPGLLVSRVRALPPHRDGWTSAAWGFVTAATELDLLELVAAGDQLVRTRKVTVDQLVHCSAVNSGRGSALARRAAGLVREGVDSPQETWLRLLLVLVGLPEPAVNRRYGTEWFYLGKPDLSYEEFKVLLEYEGDHHRTDKRQWSTDIGRYENFSSEGWTVLRVTAADRRQPRALVDRVVAALRRAGYRGPAPVFSAEWQRLFA